ncbi:MAG: 2-oxo acid dehydrogenase subunit E2 [Candidatus Handelsmanbacteria bacterium]|nr:2-oxo acid dehydrogenase subunit E2 [Candidatus Handelsmanbacteria bacterium]
MAHQIRMPALGQTSDELRVIRWLKAEGEAVKIGEPLLEVETDKATLEVEAAQGGVLLKILCREEESAEAGAVIAYVGQAGERLPEMKTDTPEVAAREVAKPAPQPATKVLATPAARRLAREHNINLSTVRGGGPEGLIETRDVQALVGAPAARISPLARKLAWEHGLDLATVRGSGPGGRIEKMDVEALQSRPDEEPVPRHRQLIARRLVQSAREIPQIRLSTTANMEAAQELVREQRGAGLAGFSYTHLLLRSLARALRAHPQLNRVWLEEGPRYRKYRRADVGLAIASEDNLLVATISEPDRLSQDELVAQVGAAVERGRRGALVRQDLAPAALTLSNLGMYGVDEFEALVDPDQAGILATGRVAEQVAVIDRGIRVVPQMKLSLSVDHRVADGAQAAQFLQTLRQILEQGAQG